MKLSVIVPVYNVAEYLPKCLESIAAPGKRRIAMGMEPGYEILLIDDGSTDSSGSICQSWADAFPSLLRCRHIANSGQGQARNVGIDMSRGEFLYFIDSDDYLIPGGMDELLELAETTEQDMVIFDSIAVNAQGRELKYMPGISHDGPLSLAACPELLLEGPDVWNKLFRRSLFTDNGIRFTPRVWFEDLRTVPKLYAFTDRISYLPKALHRYLQRPGSVTNTAKVQRNLEIIPAVDELLDFYKAQGLYDQLKDVLGYLAFHSQFLTSSVRANLAQWNSPVQDELREDFVRKFPDWKDDPYIKGISKKHKLLCFLLMHRLYYPVHLLMSINDRRKEK